MRTRRTAAYYGAQALLGALVLAALPPLRDLPLRVPITHERDGLFLTILTKAMAEDGPFHASRIGAPFGSDLVDWPLGMWLPFAQMVGLARLLGEPGMAVNLYWMSTILLAGLCATYALRRLRVGPGLSFVLGMLYAFQPYAFYRNVEHVNLAFPFVPLLALLCLRVAGTRPQDEGRGERALTSLACVAQGASFVYYSAFACVLLAVAAPLGWWRTGQAKLARRAVLAIALLAASTTATLLPSMLYWHRHGFNPDLDYKPPSETDTYGLKLRHLLVPIAEHPLPAFRAVAARVEAAGFPGENENARSKLGTLGSLGLLALLVLAVARAAGASDSRDEALDGAAALTLVTLLVASVGGLASLFSVFVSPDVRGWARIVVFLSFFSLLAAGTLLHRAAVRLPAAAQQAAQRPAARWILLGLLLTCGLADEVPVETLRRIRSGSDAAFAEERAFVRDVESSLPVHAMVFQLPQMTIPVDRATDPPMLYYDPGRAFLHSRTLRWSWGAMIGRNHDWGRAVDALPSPEKVRALALTGFSGIWIDRWGYTGERRPPSGRLEAELSALVGRPFIASSRGRYSFVSLEPYRQRLEADLGPQKAAHLREQLLADMPISRWREGCGEEAWTGDGWWRPCGPSATLELRNWRPGPLQISLRTRLRSGSTPRSLVIRGPGFEDRLVLDAGSVRPYARDLEVEGTDTGPVRLTHPRSAEVSLGVDGPLGCDGGSSACFEISALSITTRRMIGGVPVDADGGVAARTKY